MPTIFVESFSNIKIDGISAGNAFDVYSNYPELVVDLQAALVAYDEGRQSIRPQIDLSAIANLRDRSTHTGTQTASTISEMSGLDSGDLEKVRSSFHKIAAVNPPSQEQLEEWQGILDDLEIPKDALAFIP